MDEIIIRIEDASVQFDKFSIKPAKMEIPKGYIIGIQGDNGAGKTTLMRLILNLQKPTSGTIHIDEYVRTGAILECPSYYPYWSAGRNLKYQLSLIDNPKYTVKELLEMVGLKDTKKPVFRSSLGMRQRLGIALALANHPDLLFLDEPLNGLDPVGIREIRNLIQKLCYEDGITIIISSHILDELQKIATHVGFLQNGALIKECKINEIDCNSLEEFYFNEYN